jgi:hypothetical protein
MKIAIALAVLAVSLATHAAPTTPGPSNVNVVNTPTVNVATLPGVDIATMPPVKVANDPNNAARFAMTFSTNSPFYTVPAGKRLIIDFVSTESRGSVGTAPPLVRLVTSAGSIVVAQQPIPRGQDNAQTWAGNFTTHFMLNQNELIGAAPEWPLDSPDDPWRATWVTVYGVWVDMP